MTSVTSVPHIDVMRVRRCVSLDTPVWIRSDPAIFKLRLAKSITKGM